MVMSAMREKTKVVLFIALVAFVGLIFFDWGMQKSSGGGRGPNGPMVGKVNGRDIPGEAYRRTRAAVVQGFEQRTGRQPGFADFDAIEEEVWLSLVRDALVQEQIEKYDITFTDAEILEVLKTNPPGEIRAQFTDAEGRFDALGYQQALQNPALAAQWAGVEEYLRAAMPADKLQNYVAMAAHVTNDEVRERFLAREEKMRVAYVESTPARVELAEDAVTEADLRAWFTAHPEDFRTGEQAVLEFVRVVKTASAEDSSDARADLGDIRQSIVEGADFAEEATAWSDDGSAARGGDLGFISRGDMVPEFETVAFSTPVGQVSEVFSTPFGYHVLKVEERKEENGEETRQVRHILLRVEASNYTLRDAEDRIEDFLDTLNEGGEFAAAAAEHGLEVETTPAFEQGGVIPGVGLNRAAARFAFSSAPGAVTPEAVEDESNYYAFRLVERRPAGAMAFEDARDRLDSIVRQEKRREIARAELESALLSTDGSLSAIAQAIGAEVDTTIEFSREAFVPGVGRRNAFVAEAFGLSDGQRSDLVDSDRGFYVLEFVQRTPADESKLAEQTPQIRQELLIEKRQAFIEAWLEGLLADAEVVDFRSGEGVPWKPDPSLFRYGTGA